MSRASFRLLTAYNVVVSAMCVAAQMALNVALSIVFSNTIFAFTFFTGLYLCSMGMGVWWIERRVEAGAAAEPRLIANGLLAILLANPGIAVLFTLNELLSHSGGSIWSAAGGALFSLGVLLTVGLGAVAGMEFPIFSWLFESTSKQTDEPIGFRRETVILTADYVGAFVGGVLFLLIFFPLLGLLPAVIVFQWLTAAFVVLLCLRLGYTRRRSVQLLLGALAIFLTVSAATPRVFIDWLDSRHQHRAHEPRAELAVDGDRQSVTLRAAP